MMVMDRNSRVSFSRYGFIILISIRGSSHMVRDCQLSRQPIYLMDSRSTMAKNRVDSIMISVMIMIGSL